jgi:hypothetical protein
MAIITLEYKHSRHEIDVMTRLARAAAFLWCADVEQSFCLLRVCDQARHQIDQEVGDTAVTQAVDLEMVLSSSLIVLIKDRFRSNNSSSSESSVFLISLGSLARR